MLRVFPTKLSASDDIVIKYIDDGAPPASRALAKIIY